QRRDEGIRGAREPPPDRRRDRGAPSRAGDQHRPPHGRQVPHAAQYPALLPALKLPTEDERQRQPPAFVSRPSSVVRPSSFVPPWHPPPSIAYRRVRRGSPLLPPAEGALWTKSYSPTPVAWIRPSRSPG